MSRWNRMSPKEWRRIQDRKLRRYLRKEILPYHPYSQDPDRRKILKRIRSVEDLQKYPGLITQKADIVGRDKDFVLQPDQDRILRSDPLKLLGAALRNKGRLSGIAHELEMQYRDVVHTYTTGRSGARTAFVFTNYDLNGFVATGARRSFEMLALPEGGRAVSLFPAALHLAHVFVVYGAMHVPAPVIPLLGLNTEERILAIERLKPAAIFGVPGYVDRVLQRAARQGKDFSSVVRVVVGGAALSLSQRVRMRDALVAMGSPDPVIISTYGFTEARMAFLECVEGARQGMDVGYHLFPDLILVETLHITENDEGVIVSAQPAKLLEEAEVVTTVLEGHGSWVLRWRTKDKARLTEEPCPACDHAPRLLGPIRRSSSDMLKNVKATLVDFAEVELMLDANPDVLVWQIEISSRDENEIITASVAFRDGVEADVACAKVKGEFKAVTEISLDKVSLEPYETMIKRLGTDTQMKESRIVDLRPNP